MLQLTNASYKETSQLQPLISAGSQETILFIQIFTYNPFDWDPLSSGTTVNIDTIIGKRMERQNCLAKKFSDIITS